MKRPSNGHGHDGRIPPAPLLLGAAGLLPPLLAIVVRVVAGPDAPLAALALRLAILYAMLIFSFLGGMWWGAAAAKAPPERQPTLFTLAVVPSLAALLLGVLSGPFPLPSTILLGLLIAVTPAADARLCALGLLPDWWMRLRLMLSLGLGGLVLVVAALLA